LAELILYSSMCKYVLPISKNTHINTKGRDDFWGHRRRFEDDIKKY